MEDRFRTKEFQNWMKCVSAQIETVKALYGVVELLWKGYISCLTKEERDQIETFVECVEFAKIKYLKKDQQPFCDHEACVWLLKKLLKLLHNTSLPEKYYASTLPSSDSFFNAYWHIAKLFLTVEDESVTNGGLKALDIYHLSKMMNACQLFAFVGSAEAYNTICEDRDKLFHTSDYNISDGQRRSILENLSNVLSHFCNDRLKTCSYIRANIQQNQAKDWLMEYEFGYTKIVRQTLECKIAALELDLHIQESQPLRELLENTVKLHETIDITSNEKPGEQLSEMEYFKVTTLPIEEEVKDLGKPSFLDFLQQHISEQGRLDIKPKTDFLKRMKQDFYKENQDMQKYAPIGARVKRGLDWRWGNQDKGGPGTIIGHSYDKLINWCWVEWDANGEMNAYRWHINGKCDLTIIEEERIPTDGRKFAVGCRVKPGKGYKGKQNHEEGIVIKLIDEKKVQVRWKDDGTREELYFGDDGASCEAEPVPVSVYKSVKEETVLDTTTSDSEGLTEAKRISSVKPPAPKGLEVYDVYEHTACLKWQKSSEDADFSNSKYVVTYGETKNPQKRTLLEVTATLSCTLDDLKSGSEYTAEVKLVDGKRESLPARSNSFTFTTMETDKDDMRYADRILTERDADRLTSAIGANWEFLATELGVSTIPLHRIKSDNQTSASIIYHMLLHWVTNDSKPTLVRFIKALKKCPEVYFDRKVINSMKEEFKMIDMETNANPEK